MAKRLPVCTNTNTNTNTFISVTQQYKGINNINRDYVMKMIHCDGFMAEQFGP
jgi:hypothetical protein